MNCIVLIAVLGVVALNVTCLPSQDTLDDMTHPEQLDDMTYPWDDTADDVSEGSGFQNYGSFGDSAQGYAPEPQPNYDVPINAGNSYNSYNRYTGNFPQEPYGGEAKYWPSREDRTYDDREMYRRSINQLLQIIRGSQYDRREYGGRQEYDFSPYPYENNYNSGPTRFGNAYSLGPLQPERRFQNSDIFMNDPYARVDIHPSPVYTGI